MQLTYSVESSVKQTQYMRRMVCLGFRQIYEFSKMLLKFIIFLVFEGFIMIGNVVARALDLFILYINLHENVQD